jgi:YfiH family protein
MTPAEPWLRADWPAPAGIVALTTLRGDAQVGASRPPFDCFNLGGHCGDDPVAVAENRRQLRRLAALPAEPHWLRQVHGIAVQRFDAPAAQPTAVPDRGIEARECEADAAITAASDVVLAILSADCLPVLLCSDDGREIGAAHAGWRGLAAGVLEHAVAAMRHRPSQLIAWLGPAAGPSAYEIGTEVRAAFVERDAGAAAAFVATRPGHWCVDLYALARRRLVQAGVERVHGGGLCTISDPQRFFSHRRDARSGRMATLIWRASAA